jgi:hypothetical protein
MRPPIIIRKLQQRRCREGGVTIVLVALSMVAILSVAALSIDLVTLYLAREEAQSSANAAALAAVRVLSLSGVTGDTSNVQGSLPRAPWPAACDLASRTAQAVANQNVVGNTVPTSVSVTFVYNGVAGDCAAPSASFAINPQVQVKVVRQNLPNFFARIWNQSLSSVSATALAEAFNPSNSANVASAGVITVRPRCAKPWIVPNRDPGNAGLPFVSLSDGAIQNPGVQQSGSGVIGESFALLADCLTGNPNCRHGTGNGLIDNPPSNGQGPGTIDYVPALIGGTSAAVPSCASGSAYEEAIGGCDTSTVYDCGVVGAAQADLTFNPGKTSGPTVDATQCLINQSVGQDVLDTSVFPFRIQAGAGNPVLNNAFVTSSQSIVTVPIYDDKQGTANPVPFTVDQPAITVVGFLQVFVNGVDTTTGKVSVTVLNVAGCSNTATTSSPSVAGISPIPTRLVRSD